MSAPDLFGAATDARSRLSTAGLAAIAGGEVLSVEQLAVRAAVDPAEAAAVVDELRRTEAITVTHEGLVDGVGGLTTRPTRHSLTVEGRVLYTWCAFDAVGIPAALGWSAHASTNCGYCEGPIRIDFVDGAIVGGDQWGWLPSGEGCSEKLMSEFCSVADLYCTHEHLDLQHRAGTADAGVALPLEELVAVGVAVWAPGQC